MSNEYLNKTEEQQFEEAKNWFKENSTPIILAICVFAAATFGWNFWKNHQAETAIKTSAAYQNVMETYLQDPEKNAPLLSQFISDSKGTNYAVFALLEKAKQAVEKADFATAKADLQKALAESNDPSLQSVIRLRLASIDYQLKNYDDALATLGKVQSEAWLLRKQLLTADILSAKGDKVAAKSAYEQIKAQVSAQERAVIELKINQL